MGVVMPAWETRVLKVHVKAVLEAMPRAIAAKRIGSREDMAKILAEAVLSASDERTRYAILSDGMVFGPYASYDAALKACQSLPVRPGSKARIEPLIPAPKIPRATKEKNSNG